MQNCYHQYFITFTLQTIHVGFVVVYLFDYDQCHKHLHSVNTVGYGVNFPDFSCLYLCFYHVVLSYLGLIRYPCSILVFLTILSMQSIKSVPMSFVVTILKSVQLYLSRISIIASH